MVRLWSQWSLFKTVFLHFGGTWIFLRRAWGNWCKKIIFLMRYFKTSTALFLPTKPGISRKNKNFPNCLPGYYLCRDVTITISISISTRLHIWWLLGRYSAFSELLVNKVVSKSATLALKKKSSREEARSSRKRYLKILLKNSTWIIVLIPSLVVKKIWHQDFHVFTAN